MKTFITAVFAVAASFALSWFGEVYSHPIPQLALESTPSCSPLVASGPLAQTPCQRLAQNNTTSSNHRGTNP